MALHDVVGVKCEKRATADIKAQCVAYYGFTGVCWIIVRASSNLPGLLLLDAGTWSGHITIVSENALNVTPI